MSNLSDAAALAVTIDRRAGLSLHGQLYRQFSELILSGRLPAGSRLPSSRALASELRISRTAVLQAFDLLGSEGYIEGRIGAGTFVPEVLPESPIEVVTGRRSGPGGQQTGPTLSRFAAAFGPEGMANEATPAAFRPGLPETGLFPFDVWARLMARHWRRPAAALLSDRSTAGYPPLRRAIAEHLRALRGLDCEASQVIVTSSAREAITLIARATLDPGEQAWVENPGYPAIRHALAAAGARLAAVPVDREGLSVKAGRSLAGRARMAVVTPSRQFPLGPSMTLARRLELLRWAGEAGAWVVEDDYDSEYRYAGPPVSALQSLDEAGRVIYLGSFSKVLFRALRIGYVVAPRALVAPLLGLRRELGEAPSMAVQPALAEFIASGEFARHIRRMRRLYAGRQTALLAALGRHGAGLLEAERQDGGMHLVARPTAALAARLSDRDIEDRARQHGISAPALSAYYLGEAQSQGLLLGYAGVDEAEMDGAVQRLVAALEA